MVTKLDDPERILRQLRPVPETEFVAALEVALKASLRRPRLTWPRLPRRVVAGMGVAGALASIVAGLSIAGALPVNAGRTSDAKANRDCVTVKVWRLERVPRLRTGADGHLRLTTEMELLPREAIRCH
jgi:hypothetical protein